MGAPAQCNSARCAHTRPRWHRSGERLRAAAVDEGAETVDDPLETEGEGVVGAEGGPVGGSVGGDDAGSGRVSGLVQRTSEVRRVGIPPLLIAHAALADGGSGGRVGLGCASDKAQEVGQGGIHLDVIEPDPVES